MIKRFASLIWIIFILVSGCSQASPTTKSEIVEATPISSPQEGMATVTGKVVDKNRNEPLNYTVVRLAEVFREGDKGAYVLNEAFSPGARTDINGVFVFENVDAKEYVLVIGDVTSVYEIIKNDDGSARTWNAEAGEITDVGVLEVELDR